MNKFIRKSNIHDSINFIKRHKSSARSKCKKEKQHHLILRATKDDIPCILDLMKRAYYPDEPTCMSLGLSSNAVLEDRTSRSISEGYSLIAKCKYTGDIVAAAVNESTNPWDPDMMDKLACNVACARTRQLLHFYAYVMRTPDIWNKYCVQKIFELAHLFIRKDERGKGLALKLMEDSRIVAADCGYHLFRVDATSDYTAKLCEKMKLKMISEIPYCSYVAADQEPIFKPPAPHKSVKTYIDDEPQHNALKRKFSLFYNIPPTKDEKTCS